MESFGAGRGHSPGTPSSYTRFKEINHCNITKKKISSCGTFQDSLLTENMRIGPSPSLREFYNWLLQLGDTKLPVQPAPDKIKLPENFYLEIKNNPRTFRAESINEFIAMIFPDLTNIAGQSTKNWITWVTQRAILAPNNVVVDKINTLISNMFPGELTILSSADSTMDPADTTRFPLDYLNPLTLTGLPPHHPQFKA